MIRAVPISDPPVARVSLLSASGCDYAVGCAMASYPSGQRDLTVNQTA